jgi:hypothetical protein
LYCVLLQDPKEVGNPMFFLARTGRQARLDRFEGAPLSKQFEPRGTDMAIPTVVCVEAA